MKQVSTALSDLLYGQNARCYAPLLTIEFAAGTERWSGGPTALSFETTTWTLGPPFQIESERQAAGHENLEIDMLEIEIYPGTYSLTNGMTLKDAALSGLFRNRTATLSFAYMTTPGVVTGIVPAFTGTIVKAPPTSTTIKIEIASGAAKAKRPVPARTFAPSCPWVFGDANCGASLAAQTTTATVAAGSTASKVIVTATLNPLEYRTGTLTYAGQTITIADVISGSTCAVLRSPLSSAPAAGATVTITKGCQRKRSDAANGNVGTCTAYGRLVSMGGFPDVPKSEKTWVSPYAIPPPTDASPEELAGWPRAPAPLVPGSPRRGDPPRSVFSDPVPRVFGTCRVKPKCVWLNTIVPGQQGSGGHVLLKKTDGGWELKNNIPIAQAVLAICEAPIVSINRAWRGNDQLPTVADLFATEHQATTQLIFSKSSAPWDALSGTDAAGMAFGSTAHIRTTGLGTPDFDLPDVQLEITGACVRAGDTDAHPKDVLYALWTEDLGQPGSMIELVIGQDGTADSGFERYVNSTGWRIARSITSREEAINLFGEILASTNSGAFVSSAGVLTVVPLGTESVTGNGYTWTPLGTAASINADEIIQEPGQDPIEVVDVAEDELKDAYPVSISSRASDYTEVPFEFLDDARAREHGGPPDRADAVSMPWIVDPQHAYRISAVRFSNSQAHGKSYRFRVVPRWTTLEPLDPITITEPLLGLNARPARVWSIERQNDESLLIDAVAWPEGITKTVDLTPASHDGYDTAPPTSYPMVTALEALATSGAKVLKLTVDDQVFKVAKDGSYTPSSVTFTASRFGTLAGTVSFSVVSGVATLNGTGDSRTLAYADMANDSITVQASVTDTGSTYSDRVTIVKVRDGQDGAAGGTALTAFLTNESHTLAADVNGHVQSYLGASTDIKIYLGTTDDSTNWTVTNADSSGVLSSVSGRTVTLLAIGDGVDSGYVDITATKSGVGSVTKRWTIAKSKTGATGGTGPAGQPGAPAAWVEVQADNLNANTNGYYGRGVFLSSGYSGSGGGRGHTLTVFNPSSGAVLSGPTTYDTYLSGTTALVSALNGLSAGTIVTLYTYDASTCDSALRTALRGFGSGRSDTWSASRTSHAFIGMKGLASGQAYEAVSSGSDASGLVVVRAYYSTGGIVLNGATGSTGPQGPQGNTGTAGQRGSMHFYYQTTASAWDDSIANTAALTSAGSGGIIVIPDTVTLYRTTAPAWSTTKFWSGSAWLAPGAVLDGNLLVSGTVGAGAIAAGSIDTSKLGTITLDASVITTGTLNASRINTGSLTLGNVQLSGIGLVKVMGRIIVPQNCGSPYGPLTIEANRGIVSADVFHATNASNPADFIRVIVTPQLVKYANCTIFVQVSVQQGGTWIQGFDTKYIASTPVQPGYDGSGWMPEFYIMLATNAGNWVNPGALGSAMHFHVMIIDTA